MSFGETLRDLRRASTQAELHSAVSERTVSKLERGAACSAEQRGNCHRPRLAGTAHGRFVATATAGDAAGRFRSPSPRPPGHCRMTSARLPDGKLNSGN